MVFSQNIDLQPKTLPCVKLINCVHFGKSLMYSHLNCNLMNEMGQCWVLNKLKFLWSVGFIGLHSKICFKPYFYIQLDL